MALLTQCPRCGNAYVRLSDDTADKITCRRCLYVFSIATDQDPPSAPVATLPLPGPIIVSSLPTDFEIQPESDDVHEVDHIEVLDSPALPAAAPPLSAPAPAGSLALDEFPRLQPLTDEPADDSDEIVVEPIATPAAKAPKPLDDVEVVEELDGAALRQGVQAKPAIVAPVFAEIEPPEPALPPVRRDREQPLDIRKRQPERSRSVPAGVWVGVGIGAFALFLLVLVIVIILGSGSSGGQPVVEKQQAAPQKQAVLPAAAPAANSLPQPEDWPPPPDQRGPAPWFPQPRGGAAPPAATQFEGLIGYWPCDEGKGGQLADVSSNHLRSTLVGGWWIDGVRGKALLFDGRRDYLDLGDSSSLNFPHNGQFTIAGWLATRQQDGYVLAFRNPRDFAPVIQVKMSAGRLTGVVRDNGSETGEARVGLAPAADGRWHHFALVRRDGGLVEFYLDGQSIDRRRGDNSGGPISTLVRSVGCERSLVINQRTASAYFAGAIDELCISQRALTAQEIGTLAGK